MLVVAVIAAALAWQRNDTILGLVAFAWAGFGAAFGPIILLSLYWRRLTNWGALAGMFVGAATVFIWPLFNTGLYELLPGFVLGMLAAVIVSAATYRHNDEIQKEFTDTGVMVTLPRPHAVGDTP